MTIINCYFIVLCYVYFDLVSDKGFLVKCEYFRICLQRYFEPVDSSLYIQVAVVRGLQERSIHSD